MHRAKAGLWVPWHVTFSASPSLVMISRVRIAASVDVGRERVSAIHCEVFDLWNTRRDQWISEQAKRRKTDALSLVLAGALASVGEVMVAGVLT
jgi:hypothetical protein